MTHHPLSGWTGEDPFGSRFFNRDPFIWLSFETGGTVFSCCLAHSFNRSKVVFTDCSKNILKLDLDKTVLLDKQQI